MLTAPHAATAARSGTDTVNMAPVGRFSALMRPPSASTMRRATARPRPDPARRCRAGSDRWNGSKTRVRSSGAIPAPVSSTASSSHRSRRADVRVHRAAPLFKLYIVNGDEAFFGFYTVLGHWVTIKGEAHSVYDLMGKDAVLFHHTTNADDTSTDTPYVEQAKLCAPRRAVTGRSARQRRCQGIRRRGLTVGAALYLPLGPACGCGCSAPGWAGGCRHRRRCGCSAWRHWQPLLRRDFHSRSPRSSCSPRSRRRGRALVGRRGEIR